MNRIQSDMFKLLAILWNVFNIVFSPLIVLVHYSNWKEFWKDRKEIWDVLKKDLID